MDYLQKNILIMIVLFNRFAKVNHSLDHKKEQLNYENAGCGLLKFTVHCSLNDGISHGSAVTLAEAYFLSITFELLVVFFLIVANFRPLICQRDASVKESPWMPIQDGIELI